MFKTVPLCTLESKRAVYRVFLNEVVFLNLIGFCASFSNEARPLFQLFSLRCNLNNIPKRICSFNFFSAVSHSHPRYPAFPF